jgi:hypothetical protein
MSSAHSFKAPSYSQFYSYGEGRIFVVKPVLEFRFCRSSAAEIYSLWWLQSRQCLEEVSKNRLSTFKN